MMNAAFSNNHQLLCLSSLLRKRWRIAMQNLAGTAEPSEHFSQIYDEAFFGVPDDWDEASENEATTANLLFDLANPEPQSSKEPPDGFPVYLYADISDGYLSIYRYLTDTQECRPCVAWEPFNKDKFLRTIRDYQDQQTKALWYVADSAREIIPMLNKRNADSSVCRHFPDMEGVSIHVDLTDTALRIAYLLQGGIRQLKLPRWGLNAWCSTCQEQLLTQDKEHSRLMLINNTSGMLCGGEADTCPKSVPTSAFQCRRYAHLLLNLMPVTPDASVRFTGWLATKAFKEAVESVMPPRYQSIVFTPHLPFIP